MYVCDSKTLIGIYVNALVGKLEKGAFVSIHDVAGSAKFNFEQDAMVKGYSLHVENVLADGETLVVLDDVWC